MNMIVAADKNWAIGKDNSLLVVIPADQKTFRNMTLGHPVVMGRKTFESLPGGLPLDLRKNIVLTSNPEFHPKGVTVVHSLKELFEELGEEREVCFDEVKDFAECGLCGTAAVISPVGKINDHGKEICFPSGMEKMGPVTQKLYETLTGIQMGRIQAPEGWIKVVE